MLKKGSKLYSILTGSCPKCHKESMYLDKNPYNLGNIYKMHEKCSHCKTVYKIEPSFFYGAMYVSYALGVGISIITFIISKLLFKASLLNCIFSITTVLVILMPVIMRLSRNIWINIFVHYDKTLKKD